MVADLGFQERETPVPAMSKEDYMIRLLEEVVRGGKDLEGDIPRMMAWEGDILTLESAYVEADFPHDAWVVYMRATAAAAGLLRIWPNGVPGVNSSAIEIRDTSAVRIKSTSNVLHLYNPSAVTVHYFAVALSRAEVEFYALA